MVKGHWEEIAPVLREGASGVSLEPGKGEI